MIFSQIFLKNLANFSEAPLLQNTSPFDETHLSVMRGLIKAKGFLKCVNKSSSERHKYVRAEPTDRIYSNAKDLILSWRF